MTMFVLIVLVAFLVIGYVSICRRKGVFKVSEDRVFFTHLAIVVLFLAISIMNSFHLFDAINTAVYDFLRSFWGSGFDTLMLLVSNIGSSETLSIFSCLLLIVLHFRKERRLFFFTFISLVGAVVSVMTLKNFFHVARPAVSLATESSMSFPSGHSTMIVVFLSALYYAWVKMFPNSGKATKYTALSFVFILSLLVGFSRLYLGAHWLSDVIGGYLLGIFWVTFAYLSPRPKNNS